MNVCRKCGAENSPGAKFCQMCAVPLAETDAAGGERPASGSNASLSTTVVFSIEPSEPQTCPVCDAINEGDWAFCQQCGSKLRQSPADPGAERKAAVPKPKAYATTVPSSELADKVNRARASGAATCPRCSQLIVVGAAFCYKCGSPINNARTVAMSSVRATPKARLLLIVDGEATGEEFQIGGETVVGRINGDITFPHDDYMSGRHARIAKRGEKFVLVDEDSRNGSFIRIKSEAELEPGDFILLGKQLFRFEI